MKKIEKKVKTWYFQANESLYVNHLRLKSVISGKKIVHFLHIGKTGGTAFIESLKEMGALRNAPTFLESIKEIITLKKAPQKRIYAETSSYIICLHNHSVTLKDIPIGEKVFFFVRDPVQRFISGFYGRKREDKPRYYIPWSSWEKEAFNKFNTANDLALSLDCTNEETRKSALTAMRTIQHVATFLAGWITSIDYLKSREDDILFIGFQENLNSDVIKLGKLLNFPKEIDLPRDNIKMHKTPNSYKRELTDKAIKNLEEWYSRDYKIFAVCQDIASKKVKVI
jgi:hypothetical protein